jgi:hypothetical protein
VCSGRVNSSCSTSGTHRVTLVNKHNSLIHCSTVFFYVILIGCFEGSLYFQKRQHCVCNIADHIIYYIDLFVNVECDVCTFPSKHILEAFSSSHQFLVDSCYSIFSFMCMFCISLFVLLYFFFWPLCCLFFFDIHRFWLPPFGIFKLFFTLAFRAIRFRYFTSNHRVLVLNVKYLHKCGEQHFYWKVCI